VSSGNHAGRLGFNNSEKPNRSQACPGLADELHLRGPGYLFAGLCVTCGVSTVHRDADGLPRHRPPAARCPGCGELLAGGPVQFDCTGCGRPVHAADLSREIDPAPRCAAVLPSAGSCNALYATTAMHGLVPEARVTSGPATLATPAGGAS